MIPGKTPLNGDEIATLIRARDLLNTKFLGETDDVNRSRLGEAHTALVTVMRHSYVDAPERIVENATLNIPHETLMPE